MGATPLRRSTPDASISVLVPCRNAVAHVGQAMDSVLPQLAPGDAVLVQDGCSDDGTDEVLSAVVARDARVSVRRAADSGQSEALNRALDRATGDLVVWLNADDLLLPGALAAVRTAAAAHRLSHQVTPDLVIGGWQLIGRSGAVVRHEAASPLTTPDLLRRGCYVFSGALVVRREVLHRVGGYADELHYCMDYDLMLRLAAITPTQVLLDRPVAALRYHDASKSGSHRSRFLGEAARVRARHLHHTRDLVPAAVGTLVHGAALATSPLRFSSAYSRLLGKSRGGR
jgi:glycosyltransferase involved in cell wall biosynthesis